MFNPDMEGLPLEKLRKLQSERLIALAHYVYERVPFYRERFEQQGMHPSMLRGIADIARLPITYKTDLRDQYPFGLSAVPEDQIRRIHASSGTTGKPTVVVYTAEDLELFAEVNARSLYAGGARPGMKMHNAYGYGLFTGGLGIHAGAERLGMAVVPVSGGMTDRQLMLLQDFRPEVICCTPSYAQTLAEEVDKRGIGRGALNLKFGVLGAEPWTETVRADVEAGLGLVATNIYGLSEIIGPGVAQEDWEERGSGSYIWEDHFFPEILDPDTCEPLPEGHDGVLVLTTLTKKGMPLLRYWTNDICSLSYDKGGKRTHIKMSAIKGRADDMLIIRGVNLFPTQVEVLIRDIPELEPHYQLVVSKKGALDRVDVRVETGDTPLEITQLEGLRAHLMQKIRDNIGLHIDVELMPPGSIPRSEGGKLSRILDLRRNG